MSGHVRARVELRGAGRECEGMRMDVRYCAEAPGVFGNVRECAGICGISREVAGVRGDVRAFSGMCGNFGKVRECPGMCGNVRRLAGMFGDVWGCAGWFGIWSDFAGTFGIAWGCARETARASAGLRLDSRVILLRRQRILSKYMTYYASAWRFLSIYTKKITSADTYRRRVAGEYARRFFPFRISFLGGLGLSYVWEFADFILVQLTARRGNSGVCAFYCGFKLEYVDIDSIEAPAPEDVLSSVGSIIFFYIKVARIEKVNYVRAQYLVLSRQFLESTHGFY